MRRFLAGKVSVVEDGRMDGYYEEGEKYRNKRNYVPLVSPKRNYVPLVSPLQRRRIENGRRIQCRRIQLQRCFYSGNQ
jgi:hypothetical protein